MRFLERLSERRRIAKVAGRQAEFEQKWDAFATKNYAEAKALAEKALALK